MPGSTTGPEPTSETGPTPEAAPAAQPAPAPEPDVAVPAQATGDERLAEAFRRYDVAFHGHASADELLKARLDLELLLWEDGEAPPPVLDQLAADAQRLVRDTPPLE
jgi:hypothetical protein